MLEGVLRVVIALHRAHSTLHGYSSLLWVLLRLLRRVYMLLGVVSRTVVLYYMVSRMG